MEFFPYSAVELDMRRCEALEEALEEYEVGKEGVIVITEESGDGDTYFVHCEIIPLPEALQVEVPEE